MSQSKTTKRKKHRRHHRGAAFYAVPVMMLMTLALIILSYKLLKVETIAIDGTSRYQASEIITASGISIGDSMLKLKPSAAIARIENNLSYIGDVKLNFQLPTTITLVVQEANVACSVYSEGKYILVSDKLKILQTDSPLACADAPIITGIAPQRYVAGEQFQTENKDDITIIKDLFEAIDKNSFVGVETIDLSDITNIRLLCSNNCTMLLGGPSQLGYKMEFIKDVMSKNEQGSEPNGLIINAQALDNETTPNVSVLPALNINNQSQPPGSSPIIGASNETSEESEDTKSTNSETND